MPDRCSLFADLSPEQTREALRFFEAQERTYARGEALKTPLAPLRAFGLALEGHIAVTMEEIDGREMLLSHIGPGQTFGESLCYLRENAPLSITALTEARVLWLRCEGLRREPGSALERQLQQRFTAMLARRTLKMNDRIQILSRGSIREKLNAFFTELARDAGSRGFAVPFDREGMAAYLGVDRSALSRELSRMRREGLISFRKNQFSLHLQQTSGAEYSMISLLPEGAEGRSD